VAKAKKKAVWDDILEMRKKGLVDGDIAGYLQARPHIKDGYGRLCENVTVHNEGEWAKQIKENWPYIEKYGSFSDHQGYGHNKTCIIVGASPALAKNVDALKDIEGEYRDRFIIIACNSIVEYLLKNDIKPDIIIAVDCDEEVWTRDLSKVNREDLLLFASPFAWPEVAKNWKGTLRWIPMKCPDESLEKELLKALNANQLVSGCGNAFNESVLLGLIILGCKNYIFIGSELSWEEGSRYYVDEKHSNDETIQKFAVMDIFGKKVFTTPGHWMFKIWLEDVASKSDGMFINATEAGILGMSPEDGRLPWIHQFRLKEAIAKIHQIYDASKDWRFVESIKYETAWIAGYNHKGTWPLKFIDGLEVKTIMEVGCGNGSGVKKLIKKGYDAYGCDISSLASNKWNGVKDKCILAFADDIPCEDKYFDLVTTDILEHLPLDKLPDTLLELKRIGKHLLFHLDYNPAEWKIKNKYEPHTIVRPSGWWRKEFKRSGLKVIKNPNHRTFVLKEK